MWLKQNNLKLVKIISRALITIVLCVGVFFIVRVVLNKGKDGMIDNAKRLPNRANGVMKWYSFMPTTKSTYSIYDFIELMERTPSYGVKYVISLYKHMLESTIDNNYFITKRVDSIMVKV